MRTGRPRQNDATSSVAKAPTGIEGFDEITGGGWPRGRTSLLVGEPGAGKTVLALQSLVNGASTFNEPGIFVAFEEDSRRIIANAATFGWDLPALAKKKLFFLDAQVSPDVALGGAFDLTGLIAGIKAKAQAMGAKRIVIDGIDVLLTLLDDPVLERTEIHRLHEFLLAAGLTAIITSKAERSPSGSADRYGFMQFMVDCTVLLRHHVVDRVSLRELRVMKYRGSSFAENAFPLSISGRGFDVAGLGSPATEVDASSERISTGVDRLDAMLNGGYFRGASILISGSPGSAKSTLAGTFIDAACRRGESGLYVSFDERESDIVRNRSSVGILFAPHLKSHKLHMHSPRTETMSAEEHLLAVKRMIREYKPACLVIDPLSAMTKAGGQSNALDVAQRLLRLAKSEGITVLCTSLLERSDGAAEETPLHICTFADTWIHLSYIARGGERNRALTICKSRGMKHSNQVRELVLSDEGVTLTDVYVAGGEVLTGTARWEAEAATEAESKSDQAEFEFKRASLEQAQAEVRARMEAVKRERDVRRAELTLLTSKEKSRRSINANRKTDLLERRGADKTSRRRATRAKRVTSNVNGNGA